MTLMDVAQKGSLPLRSLGIYAGEVHLGLLGEVPPPGPRVARAPDYLFWYGFDTGDADAIRPKDAAMAAPDDVYRTFLYARDVTRALAVHLAAMAATPGEAP